MDRNIEKSIRERVFPKLYDYCYVVTKSNLETFKLLLSMMDDKTSIRILDLGCGYKPFERLFKGKAYDYVGIDIDKDSFADILLDLNFFMNDISMKLVCL